MNALWSEARVKVSHRLAMHVQVERFRLNNAAPMVSFTFDDLPKSAATLGADILESYGARGTFYVSGGLVGLDARFWATGNADDVVSLHRRGHEVGCHTFSHRRACDLDEGSLTAEIARNRTYLHSLDPTMPVETFAYPFGYGSYARKHQLKSEFRTCRSIMPGVNSGEVDLQFLRAMPLIDRQMSRERIDTAFGEAANTNGWLIFYSHDVADAPSLYGCSPDLMTYTLEAAARRNMPVLTMAEAFRCARA
ncbi:MULTISPECIES: polysaccharide deacetylase family protein [Bradyrhizobium]|jgi:peptidoglycan/xylan/chitin deacetylase (PgdA/CDA1 family)|uniref:polysaccharide deacetylase family protein n=1 Tax=Bradyrhizobium TaxID=374 RepID=UPI00041988EB|nr:MULTISPECIES: polysaccharide deacetylase family protein [Bradyrhizobium]KIU49257.1 xylanase [Bradyrhizobium elkanii]OCX28295.1 xylanase [Bradyrhizobium sp. UASWS1016]